MITRGRKITSKAFGACSRGLASYKNNKNYYEVVNPYNGKFIDTIYIDDQEDVERKFLRAARGQKQWNDVALDEKKGILSRFAQLLMQDSERLAFLLTSETGKPITQSRSEVRATGQRIRFFVDNAHHVLEPRTTHSSSKLTERVVYEPLGVIANISAWNYPYFVAANVLGAALVTGNAVLFKPSEFASLSGLAMAELLHKAGVPEDVFVTSTGKGQTGQAVAGLPGLGGIFFTGSVQSGRSVYQSAAKNFTKVQLELGGKDASYVKKDVPSVSQVAASLVDGAFYNAGQSCCSVERIFVDREVYQPFLDHFLRATLALKVGDPEDEETFVGPLARRAQVPFLRSQVADALQKGASILTGRLNLETSDERFFFPTVIADATPQMAVMQDESFGPIVAIQAVDGEEDAVALMEDSKYGLTAGVYCRDQEDAERILSRLNVGSGYWNCCDRSVPRLPWSGRKESGVGVTLSLDGLRACVQPKALHLQLP